MVLWLIDAQAVAEVSFAGNTYEHDLAEEDRSMTSKNGYACR
jgi:hypothetical protein